MNKFYLWVEIYRVSQKSRQKLVFYNLGSELATILSSRASRFTTFFHFYFYILHSFSFFKLRHAWKTEKSSAEKIFINRLYSKKKSKAGFQTKKTSQKNSNISHSTPKTSILLQFTSIHEIEVLCWISSNFSITILIIINWKKPLSSVTNEHGDSLLVNKTTGKYKQFEWIWRQAHLISFWLKCQWIILVFLTCVRSLLKYKLELEMSLQVHCMKHQHVLYM